jgi:hypothetical protein
VFRTPSQNVAGVAAGVTTGWTTASTGVMTRNVVFNAEGLWSIECRGVGNSVDGVQTFTFDVKKSAVI